VRSIKPAGRANIFSNSKMPADTQAAVADAQAAVIRSLENLKSTVIQAGDSVSYLNAEVPFINLFL
jgi:hypothetical protein